MTTQHSTRKKYYTVQEANATLPLVCSILRDITELAKDMRDRHERLARLQDVPKLDRSRQEEIEAILAELDRGQERMLELEEELRKLHVELKDYFIGLIDFRCLMNGREVYLCYRLGEPEVGHWHELDAGYSGRQKLMGVKGQGIR